jgi:hypothetical protein
MLGRQRNRKMRNIYYILTLFILTNCGNGQRQNENVELKTTDTTETDNTEIRYTDQQLENFLDSIGSLSPSLWADSVSFVADSTFKNQLQMDKLIAQADFTKLKRAVKEEEIFRTIDTKTAKNIFGEIQVDSSFLAEGKIPVTFFPFGKRKDDFDEFAICLGSTEAGEYGWSCVLYFFKNNKIIAKHNIYHRYGLELKDYIDSDGKTIIYYKENFGSGTGIWQFNNYFYKFYGDKLIPILNELENGNLNGWGSRRSFWLESFVTKTTPLTLKMVYHQELYDTNDSNPKIVDDSTFVQYTWDEKTRTLIGNYEKTKINKLQTLTYYLADNELLFINTYYSTLKDCLKDKTKRNIVLNYLNGIKNYYENK